MISESIFQKNLEGLTYKERAEIEMADLNQKIKQITQQTDKHLEQRDQQIKQT